jgi:hypothetical protein
MSVRIAVNLALGPADCALDRGPDGGRWLSLRQGGEVVLVKLSTSSLEALWLTLARGLAMAVVDGTAPGNTGCD